MNIKDMEGYVESFRALDEVNRPLAMRILLVRHIMEQRGLNSTHISELTGYGKRWVIQTLTFGAIRLDDSDKTDRRVTQATVDERLDVIEDAITQWTREQGGVYAVSGATQDYVDDFKNIMSSAQAQQSFNGQED